MVCKSPLKVKDRNGFVHLAPCGCCFSCRLQRASVWATRCILELDGWSDSCFLTLTYDGSNCPSDIEPRDFQLFVKRLRKLLAPKKVKYFASGEYGEVTGRPHYHAILFGVPEKFDFSDLWTFGFTYSGSVTWQSCKYVAEYIYKKWYGVARDEKTQPFMLCSRGLGLDNFLRNSDTFLTYGLTFDGYKRKLPPYFLRKVKEYVDFPDKLPEKYVDKLPGFKAYVEAHATTSENHAEVYASEEKKLFPLAREGYHVFIPRFGTPSVAVQDNFKRNYVDKRSFAVRYGRKPKKL